MVKNNKIWQIGLVMLLCCIVAVSGCTTTENTTTSDTSGTNASSTEDVLVTVNYNGNWGGSASGEFGYKELSGNGEQTVNLGKISGILTVSTWTTAGTGPMSLKITRGDETLGEQSNSYPSATVTITV
ncbi:hypothetical protein HYG87_09460 [Methanobacterium alkalithermotolerans]|uniref:Uncharacterized protein n=1 Tax=Methanobacterium alkalithermotolerans TaxID=2731220 RepID=A0A8T8K7G9_9EURY|nr:hypothetical protein [Methanobacterium alkalithermotolerans]QUH23967.1 hypothetical protein HYG87_09460 [Methanobacterium alkalithermotolerans]